MTIRSTVFILCAAFAIARPVLTAQDVRLFLSNAGTNSQPSVRFGAAITRVADRNGDGLPEILIGDDGWEDNVGEVRGYQSSGASLNFVASLFNLADPSERFGAALCDVGVDTAGTVWCAIGAPAYDGIGVDSGRVFIWNINGPIMPLKIIPGLSAGEEFGATLATLGDLDGDGLAEILVGAPKANIGGANAGRVSLLNGATGALIYSVNGAPGSLFGSSIAAGKDVNSDGVADFIVGAPNDATVGTNRGRAFVMSGATGALIMTLNGNSNGDNFGRAVTLLRDMNGDGRAEIAVSAPGDDVGMSNNGAVTIHDGLTGTTLRTVIGEAPSDLWGQALSAGDADHDGKDDLLVGSPFADRGVTNNGVAVLYSGDNGAVLWRADGRKAGGEFGHAAVFLGDFSGTGIEEFAVSEWKFDRSVSVVSLAPLPYPRLHSTPESEFVFEIGDIDGDGRRDLAFTESVLSLGDNPPKVALMSSASRRILRRLISPSAVSLPAVIPSFGRSVCDVGDVDLDGVPDIFVGEPFFAVSSGYAHLYSGATGTLLTTIPGVGPIFGRFSVGIGDTNGNGQKEVVVGGASDGFVHCYDLPSGNLLWSNKVTTQPVRIAFLDVVGDVNGDGKNDIVAGSHLDGPTATPLGIMNEGLARVLSGVDGSVIYGYPGSPTNLEVGLAGGGVRDQNGDGFTDFAVYSFDGVAASMTVYSGQNGSPLMTIPAGGITKAVDDFTGDGIPDLVVTNGSDSRYFEGGTGAALGGPFSLPTSAGPRLFVDDLNGDRLPECFIADESAHGEYAAAGAFRRGEKIKGNQRLSLAWNESGGSTPTDGTVEISQGAPFSTAFLLISARAQTAAVGPYVTYLDVFDSTFLSIALALGSAGEAGFFADLRDPLLANFVLHLQVIDTTTGPDGLHSMSNGLVLRFMP